MFKKIFKTGQSVIKPERDCLSTVDDQGTVSNADIHQQMLDELPDDIGIDFAREFCKGKMTDAEIDTLFPLQSIA